MPGLILEVGDAAVSKEECFPEAVYILLGETENGGINNKPVMSGNGENFELKVGQ